MAQPTFNEWRRNLSRQINRSLGISMNKLPQFPLEEWWRDGVSVRDAVNIIQDELGDHMDTDTDNWGEYAY